MERMARAAIAGVCRRRSCEGNERGFLEGAGPTLVTRNLDTGEERVVFDADRITDVALSPDGSRVVFRAAPAGGPLRFIIAGEGEPQQLDLRRFIGNVLSEPSGDPLWIDNDHLLLRHENRGWRRLDFSGRREAAVVVIRADDGSVVREYGIPRFFGSRVFR